MISGNFGYDIRKFVIRGFSKFFLPMSLYISTLAFFSLQHAFTDVRVDFLYACISRRFGVQ